MWNVNICDYGLNDEEEYYVTYRIYDLDDKTKDYLVNTLEGKITVEDNSILFDVVFPEKIFPFKTEEAKLKPDDFIARAREEIEMGFFITGLLEDMK